MTSKTWADIDGKPWSGARVDGAVLDGTPWVGVATPAGNIVVEIAWGADLTASPSTWGFVDVTADVMQANDGIISISPIGRTDEFATAAPAQCTAVVLNLSGDYSKGPQSSNYPNVRRGTPFRTTMNVGTGAVVRFQGESTGFAPGWDTTGKLPIVTITASGVSRRLAQGKSPVKSALAGKIPTTPNLLGYWTMEDGVSATQFASGVSGGIPMQWATGAVYDPFTCAAVSGGPGSAPLPNLAQESSIFSLATASIPVSNDTQWSFGCLAWTASSASPANSIALPRAYPSGGTWYSIVLNLNSSDGAVRVIATDLATLTNNSVIIYVPSSGSIFDGLYHEYWVSVKQNGGNADFALEIDGVQVATGSAAGTLAHMSTIGVQSGFTQPATMGHVAVWSSATSVAGFATAAGGYVGELVTSRLARLAVENNTSMTIVGSSTVQMGGQGVDTLLNLLDQCERTDQGILVDGQGPGFTYYTSSHRENALAALTVDGAALQLGDGFTPVDDDQRIRNQITANQLNGSSFTALDINGSLGSDAVGTYDDSVDVNLHAEGDLQGLAQWLLHVGTDESDYRYPNLTLDLMAVPALQAGWNSASITSRIDVTGISTAATNHPSGTISGLVEGWAETLSPTQWVVTPNLGPATPWRVGTVAADSGDTSEFLMRVSPDAGDFILGHSASAGATSIIVDVLGVSGVAVFTTNADDVPFDLKIGGWKVTVRFVAAVSGGTQTLTVDALPGALASGAAVDLWNSPVVGMG
jgi:hypothetical protein